MAKRKQTTSSPVLAVLGRLVLWTIGVLPLPVARALGAGFGRLCWLLPNKLRRISRLNLAWCFPEATAGERQRLLGRSLAATGRFYAESGAILRWPGSRLARLEAGTVGEELLDEAIAAGKGAVVLAPHVGNWEMFNHYLMRRHPFVALYRKPRVAELETLLLEARERTGCRMLPANPHGIRQLYRALEAGELLFILPDQEPIRSSGVFAPFFGVPALTMTLVARLLRKFDAPALLAWTTRGRDGRFTYNFRRTAGLDDPDPLVAATALNRAVEECVRECPEQYLWSYKRFKSRPAEEEHALRVLGDPSGVRLYRKRP